MSVSISVSQTGATSSRAAQGPRPQRRRRAHVVGAGWLCVRCLLSWSRVILRSSLRTHTRGRARGNRHADPVGCLASERAAGPQPGHARAPQSKYARDLPLVGLSGFHDIWCASGVGPTSDGAVPARVGMARLLGCARRSCAPDGPRSDGSTGRLVPATWQDGGDGGGSWWRRPWWQW